ncbi:hypothetical protein BH11BAC4_BH11BAC4_21590 [soil metagenome]
MFDIIKCQQPRYSKLFADKGNLYFTVDNYPFETSDRLESAKWILKTQKFP